MVWMLLSVTVTKRGTSQVGIGRHVPEKRGGGKKCGAGMRRNEACGGLRKRKKKCDAGIKGNEGCGGVRKGKPIRLVWPKWNEVCYE